ncbi:MAG: hypothetical protein ACRDQF_05000, partial [Thermocrispum sp.]
MATTPTCTIDSRVVATCRQHTARLVVDDGPAGRRGLDSKAAAVLMFSVCGLCYASTHELEAAARSAAALGVTALRAGRR